MYSINYSLEPQLQTFKTEMNELSRSSTVLQKATAPIPGSYDKYG